MGRTNGVWGIAMASALVLGTSGAMAADITNYGGGLKDTPYYAYNWTGVYGGVHGGGIWGTQDSKFVQAPLLANPGTSIDFNGGVIGGQLGAQYQFYNNIVAGVEVSFTGSGTATASKTPCMGVAAATCEGNAKREIQVVGRLGYAWGNFLPYVKGGYAQVDMNETAHPAGFGFGFDDSHRHNGWVAGGGVEYAVTHDVIIGIDYSHIETETVGYGDPTLGLLHNVDASLDLLTGRISYKLGWDHTPLK